MSQVLWVLPRDAFNAANMLKCIGQLTLLIHDGKIPELRFEHDGQPLDVQIDPINGGMVATNIQFYLNDRLIEFYRPLNSRQPWPLYESEESEPVFDTTGNWIYKTESGVAIK